MKLHILESCQWYVLALNGPCRDASAYVTWEGCRNEHLVEKWYCVYHFDTWSTDIAKHKRLQCDCGEAILLRYHFNVAWLHAGNHPISREAPR